MEVELDRLLKDHFGHEEFRPGQREIIADLFAKNDTMAVMPTGGGKSLCYQLPALAQPGLVVVISPLISLMKDQVRLLRERNIPAGCIHSGQSREEKLAVFQEANHSPRFLLYLSPERVQKPGFAAYIKERPVNLFAIDEAHCISQWGPDFREDYHRLELLRDLRPDVPILALTATATPQVLRDIRRQLRLQKPEKHIHGFYRPNLYYQVEWCEGDAQKFLFLRQALEQYPEGRILIYCGTRKQCEGLSESLSADFAGVDHYHAGLPNEQRHRVQQEFERGETRILAATNAFGMGIDHPDVRLVVHFHMPANIESLYQEMGRAGRDGQNSTCLLLYSRKDKSLQSFFIRESKATGNHLRYRWDALETIVQYAEGGECRHGGILTYFQDARRLMQCGHCDACDPKSPRRIVLSDSDRTLAAVPRRSAGKKTKKAFEGPLSPEANARAQMLKEWRKNFAKSRDLPAFMIFSNKTLHDLAHRAPANNEELAAVYGMGPQKIENFGADLLQALRGEP